MKQCEHVWGKLCLGDYGNDCYRCLRNEIIDLRQQLKNIKTQEAQPNVYYKCDHRACESCGNHECGYTSNIRHAENFKLDGQGNFIEK